MKKNASRVSLNAGFSLMEMILVLAVLSLGFIPLIQLFSGGIISGNQTNKMTTAVKLSEEKIEMLRGLPFSSIANSSEPKGSISGFSDFSRITTVESTYSNLAKISVTTLWGGQTTFEAFSLSTYVSNYH